jgi:hypothetical protein
MSKASARDGQWNKPVFQQQADATLSQANPVSGTKYTVLDTVKNARIITIAITVTWTVQPAPLEVWVTIDGQTLRFFHATPVSAQPYEAITNAPQNADQPLIEIGAWATEPYNFGFLLEGRSVKVEVETTGGTVSNLSARVKYAKIP